jgi:N-acetylglucosaminyldiphosphoundecaprenol N-acetyl-beta-D-mannosaminyltransferase
MSQDFRVLVLRDVHGVMRARNDAKLQRAHEAADLMAPDGMPLSLVARLGGIDGISCVCGPDLLPAACEHGLSFGWRHYFFGDAPGVAESVIAHLSEKYPGISIAGFHCPPFRSLSQNEDELVCEKIRAARPDFV